MNKKQISDIKKFFEDLRRFEDQIKWCIYDGTYFKLPIRSKLKMKLKLKRDLMLKDINIDIKNQIFNTFLNERQWCIRKTKGSYSSNGNRKAALLRMFLSPLSSFDQCYPGIYWIENYDASGKRNTYLHVIYDRVIYSLGGYYKKTVHVYGILEACAKANHMNLKGKLTGEGNRKIDLTIAQAILNSSNEELAQFNNFLCHKFGIMHPRIPSILLGYLVHGFQMENPIYIPKEIVWIIIRYVMV